MSRRAQITMSPDEVQAFLVERKVASVATLGPNGRPHLVPLWYVPAGDQLTTWTYRSSQKVRNLERDPHATVLVEAGASYEELRGVSLECDVRIISDAGQIATIGFKVLGRYRGEQDSSTEASRFVRAQAAKRVGLVFTPTSVVSWDHRKLGGVY